jgi:hypothetical protein
LTELQKAGRISFWAFITHKPEDDEGGKKEHSHVYVEPSKMLQTDDLKEALKEFDPTNPTKPLGCISWLSSKFDPWYLYALHDKRYLASKSQSRRFHYSSDDFRSSDDDELLFKVKSIDMISLSPYADMEDAISQGLTFSEYFSRGTVPLAQVVLFQRAWDLLIQTHTDRNGRQGHVNAVFDVDTGELIENPDKPLCKSEELFNTSKSDVEFTVLDEDDELPF